MGPIIKEVSKFLSLFIHRPTEARLSPTPPHSQTRQSQKTKCYDFFSCEPHNSKNGRNEATKDTDLAGKGIGKNKTDSLKSLSFGKAHVAGNSVLTSFFLWAEAEGTPKRSSSATAMIAETNQRHQRAAMLAFSPA